MATNKDLNELKIQELFDKVDDIVREMESGDMSLEDSFSSYKKATLMLELCKKKIDGIEKELQIIGDDLGDE